MTKKRKLKYVLAFCLVAVVCVMTIAMTGAWFTGNKVVSGSSTLSTINVEIWNSANSLISGNTSILDKSTVPGQKILLNAVTLKSSTATTTAYLRVTVFITNDYVSYVGTTTTAGGVSNMSPASGWYALNTNSTVTVSSVKYARLTYIYGTSASATSVASATLKTGLTIYSSGICVTNSLATSGAVIAVYLRADAIQTDGIISTPSEVNTAMGGYASSWT